MAGPPDRQRGQPKADDSRNGAGLLMVWTPAIKKAGEPESGGREERGPAVRDQLHVPRLVNGPPRPEVEVMVTLFCFFILMNPSESQLVGMTSVLEDKFEIDKQI